MVFLGLMKIKFCGITNIDDAIDAVSFNVDAIGFIFVKNSPRYISPEKAEEIAMNIPPFIQLVGVFADHDQQEIIDIATRCKLDLIQLHGDESPSFCLSMPRRVIKAFRISDLDDIQNIASYQGVVAAVLLDTFVEGMNGGTGKTFDWGLALQAKEYEIPIILSGGINSSNIKKAINLVNPYAVDISSSIEAEPGKKDYNKMKELIDIANTL